MPSAVSRKITTSACLVLAATAISSCSRSAEKKAEPTGAGAPSAYAEAHPPDSAPRPADSAAGGAPRIQPPIIEVGKEGRSTRLASLPGGFEMKEGVFSADGRSVAFVATRDGKAYVFLDGKQGKPYDEVGELTFRAGGKGFAFAASEGGARFVVADGVEGVRYAAIGKLRFAPDGKVVYSAARDEKWRVVVGSRESPAVYSADPEPFVGADGKRVVFVERQPGAPRANLRACSLDFQGCVSGPVYESIAGPWMDLAGLRLGAIVEKEGKKTVAVVALDRPGLVERLGKWFDDVRLFAISRGGGHLAFVAQRATEEVLVRDGVEVPLPGVESPLDLVVSTAGRVLCTAFTEKKLAAYLDGQRVGGEFKGLDFPTFSPDGARHAFVAKSEGSEALVVEGVEGPSFDKVVSPQFTRDGSRVVYRARRNGERFVVVWDLASKTTRAFPHYEAVFEVVVAPDGASMGYGVRKGQELLWMVEKL